MEADDTILLNFGDPQGILNQQLKPRLIRLINIIIILIKDVVLYIIYYSIGNKLRTIPPKGLYGLPQIHLVWCKIQ